MKKYSFLTSIYGLVFLLSCTSCSGQEIAKSDKNKNGASKVIKNYFITQYPQEFFSVQGGLQDQKGNMWFATGGNGIYVYDGASFINFTHLDGLCHDDILCCREDKSGNIWFGTRNGLIRYKPSGNKPEKKDFKSFLISANTINRSTRAKIPYTFKPADNFVWYILQDKSGKLWFSTNKGIYIHDPAIDDVGETPLFAQFIDNSVINKNNLHLKDVSGMLQDKQGTMWFVSGYMEGEGICCYDGQSLTNFRPDNLSQFRNIIERKNGELLFLNVFHGAYTYKPVVSTVPTENNFTSFRKQTGMKNDTLVAMLEDKAGNLWFGCQSDAMFNGGKGGVWCYDGNSFTLLTTKDGLSHNCVFTIVEDKTGNIWFGTRNTGLCRYDGKTFTNFTE